MRLAGKVAVVTGAASGIGAATARKFVEEGARVILADRDAAAGETLAQALGEAARFVKTDVAILPELKAAIEAAEGAFGGLDILFNNAGIQPTWDVESTTEAQWDQVQAINLKAVFFGMQYAIAPMRRRGGGAIVNTSSTFAIVGSPGYSAYHASKGGVSSLTRGAAIALIKDRIRVNAICPGTTMTPGLVEGTRSTAKDFDAAMASYLALQPLRRFGTAEEIANVVAFLASDEASFVVGANVMADGGYTIV